VDAALKGEVMRRWTLTIVLLLAIPLAGAFVGYGEYSATSRAAWTYNHGVALLAKGDTEGAIADFDESARLNPRHHFSFYARASAYYAKQDFGAAAADIDAAIRLDPTYTGAYVLRGNIAWARGDIDQAIADYQAALAIEPTYAPAIRNLQDAKAARAAR
jgi:tetratricopeptide (TPR) repeat protein